MITPLFLFLLPLLPHPPSSVKTDQELTLQRPISKLPDCERLRKEYDMTLWENQFGVQWCEWIRLRQERMDRGGHEIFSIKERGEWILLKKKWDTLKKKIDEEYDRSRR